jgi:prepilin peptidase CpaA
MPAIPHHFLVLAAVLAIAAFSDWRERKIPNLLVYPAMLVGLGYHSSLNGWDGLLFSLSGLCAGLGILLVPHLLGGMGAGDVKLMAAVGSFIGAMGVFLSFIYTALAGGIYAIIVLILNRESFKGFLKQQYQNVLVFAMTRQFVHEPGTHQKQLRICYGVAIAFGTSVHLISVINR